jgi:cysteine synthase
MTPTGQCQTLVLIPEFRLIHNSLCLRITDAEAVSMSRHLVKHDGLFLGSSSACNLVACVKLAKKLKLEQSQADGNEQRKLVIVTIL